MGQTDHKKKIAILIPEFPVLTETFIQRDIVKLMELGNLDVEVLYLKRGRGHLDRSLEKFIHRINLNIIDLLFSLKYLILKKGEIRRIDHILKGDLTRSVPARYYLLFKSLGYANIIKNYKPDELHIHFYSDFSTIGMFTAIILGIPFSINAHARDVFEYPHLPKSKANLAKFVTVCNKAAHERCMQISQAGEDKVHLIHHGIDPDSIFPSDIKVKKADTPMIFMGGTRLTEKKGIKYMLQASKILKERGISHRVDLIGVGEGYQALSDKIRETGLEKIFYIHGEGKGMPFEQLAEYYLAADLFVLPIIQARSGDSDGIPNVIIEAALAKLPIITTDAGSVSELIIDDVTGVVVPQKDPEALATEIERLLIDNERKERLGSAASGKAREMFDQDRNVKKLEKLLLD